MKKVDYVVSDLVVSSKAICWLVHEYLSNMHNSCRTNEFLSNIQYSLGYIVYWTGSQVFHKQIACDRSLTIWSTFPYTKLKKKLGRGKERVVKPSLPEPPLVCIPFIDCLSRDTIAMVGSCVAYLGPINV